MVKPRDPFSETKGITIKVDPDKEHKLDLKAVHIKFLLDVLNQTAFQGDKVHMVVEVMDRLMHPFVDGEDRVAASDG